MINSTLGTRLWSTSMSKIQMWVAIRVAVRAASLGLKSINRLMICIACLSLYSTEEPAIIFRCGTWKFRIQSRSITISLKIINLVFQSLNWQPGNWLVSE